MKHIKLFRLFENESSDNDVNIHGLFTSSKWVAVFEAVGIQRIDKINQEIPAEKKNHIEKIVNMVLPSDLTLNTVQLLQTAISGRNDKIVAFEGNADFEYLKKFLVKPLYRYSNDCPAEFYLDQAEVLVEGINKETISLRFLSRDDRRDKTKDLEGFRTGVRFVKKVTPNDIDKIESIIAEELINISIENNKDIFRNKYQKNNPETVDQFNVFCDIVAGMIASAGGHPEFGPSDERRKELHDIILNTGDHRIMNFSKKYYPDLWEEIQAATGGGAEALADLTELGF
jgi:hypothetical protein